MIKIDIYAYVPIYGQAGMVPEEIDLQKYGLLEILNLDSLSLKEGQRIVYDKGRLIEKLEMNGTPKDLIDILKKIRGESLIIECYKSDKND